ncbi:MAG TPA: NAD(P)-binding domain-containing protein, partial [Candidatus Polarisedimenticolia bacterium]|nr:NAD(P)-binding domain-containing protein [Candidatus Polarisedimenticolia bacterium]
MQLGFVGLGKMGLNMVQRLMGGGHDVVASARTAASIGKAEALGARGAPDLAELVASLPPPRVVWLMIPS